MGDGSNQAVQVVPVPNPNPRCLSVRLEGRAESLDLRIYSAAQSLARQARLPQAYQAGWNQVPLGAGLLEGLPNGLYYVVVQPQRAGQPGFAGPTAKMLLLR